MTQNVKDSVLRYNGVDIPYLRTEKFVQEPVWATDGTDLLYTHINIGVSGILHSCFLNGTDPSVWIEQNRPLLMQRGGQLYFYVGGTQMMPSPGSTRTGGAKPPVNVTPSQGTELVASPEYKTAGSSGPGSMIDALMDARLGPKPVRCDIRAIRGGSFSIYYEIETWLPYCYDGSNPSVILSNRWESVLDIDKDYFYTRTTNGAMVLNSQYVNLAGVDDWQWPQDFLTANVNLLLPPLPPAWKRDVVHCVLSSDGLTLNYIIQDRQQYVAIPRPAAHIEANYAEIMPAGQMPTAGMGFALLNVMQINMEVTVSGDPNVYIAQNYSNPYPTNEATPGDPTTLYDDQLKFTLMQIMFQVVFSRIRFPFIQSGTSWGQIDPNSNNCFITHLEMHEDLMRPVVGCKVVAFQTRPQVANRVGANASWNPSSAIWNATNIGRPLTLPDMYQQVSTQPWSLGNYATFLFIQNCLPHDPCSTTFTAEVGSNYASYPTVVFTSRVTSANAVTPTAGYAQTVGLALSNASYAYPFTEYTATVDYYTSNELIQCPKMYPPAVASGQCVFINTASPVSQKIIHWKASRMGSWPKMPKPTDVGANAGDQMLDYQMGFGEVELSNDMITRHYHITGVYKIGMLQRVQWDTLTALPTIVNPIIASSTYGDADSSYPTSYMVYGITGPGPSPGTWP